MVVVRGSRLLVVAVVGALVLSGVLFSSVRAWASGVGHISGAVITDSHPGPGAPISGLTVHLLLQQPLSPIDVAQATTALDGSYDFVVPAGGDYEVYVDGGTSRVDGSDGVLGYDPAAPGSGDVQTIELARAYSISGVVLGSGHPIPDVEVTVEDSAGGNVGTNITPISLYGTEADGRYTIKVPVTTDDYRLVADGGQGWHEQAYHLIDDPCPCGGVGDPVTVNGSSVAGIDFDLTPNDLAFDLYVERETTTGSGVFAAINGLTVVIEQLRGTTWTEVHRETTTASGLVYFTAPLSGDFRVRFESGSSGLRYLDSITFPRAVYDPAGGCVATYSGLGPGSYIDVEYGFSFSDVSCSVNNPPAHSGSKPRPAKPRPAAVGTSALVLPTATPTPTPTPTSTPSTAPSDSASLTPSDQPSSPSTAPASFDPTWIGIVVLIVILALIAFFLTRLIRGRRP